MPLIFLNTVVNLLGDEKPASSAMVDILYFLKVESVLSRLITYLILRLLM